MTGCQCVLFITGRQSLSSATIVQVTRQLRDERLINEQERAPGAELKVTASALIGAVRSVYFEMALVDEAIER